MAVFIPHILLPLQKPIAYIDHNAIQLLSDITEGNLQDFMQIPQEPQKALNYFFHTCSITPQDLFNTL